MVLTPGGVNRSSLINFKPDSALSGLETKVMKLISISTQHELNSDMAYKGFLAN